MALAVCATPIGNLDDVTLRVLEELRSADVVLCEDTRHTRGLLERHGIQARLLSYHEHNEAKRTAELLPRLAAGERVALVSDAGMPGISDPGARLVDAALEAGVAVTVLPGPSAVETALVASGLARGRFEEVVRGRAAEVAERFAEAPKGEITLVLGPGPAGAPDASGAAEAVAELVASGVSRRRAAEVISRLTGVGRNELYRRTL